ncbi:UDP-2,4-diacetamido-2,4,6-trideoxy-beta-L-altropyranose hydrolase [uncultured Paenibacillus sp.]|uniref:UDP-2,4-diacetamido-2,4, 6-trideoxy-beta-L-altropyranose hydrolase n=1 Tax=uncultured Paenibacillus sp. TaxID=227322 RepID=UPI0028D0C948|nr:UDP-2,4-diacetamido-2,4,6-trideoxy-beta-L-altropyranose hydrolase [uncultured Paenibacillus sp.]
MRIVIRADASSRVGTGHVMRCLTLADLLRRQGCVVRFLMQRLDGHLQELVTASGYDVTMLEISEGASTWEDDAEASIQAIEEWHGRVEWCVVDHYGLDSRWEHKLRGFAESIMVIDDLADRSHDCDLLLDQNFVEQMESRYDGLVPDSCLQLLGPKHMLLRDEFIQAKPLAFRRRREGVRKVLLFFGGADPTNETEKVITAIKPFLNDGPVVDVVVGRTNPNRSTIEAMCAGHDRLHFHLQVSNMAEMMGSADFSFGAGGVTMWERCYLGLPSAVVIVADNQAASVEAAAKLGAVWNLGRHEAVKIPDIADIFYRAVIGRAELLEMSRIGMRLIDEHSPEDDRPGAEVVKVMLRHKGDSE